MLQHLNLIPRRYRASVTAKFYPKHQYGQMHKYVQPRNLEIKGPTWSNFVSWPLEHQNWYRKRDFNLNSEIIT